MTVPILSDHRLIIDITCVTNHARPVRVTLPRVKRRLNKTWGRLLFNTLTAISLLLAIATAGLWVASHRCPKPDLLDHGHAPLMGFRQWAWRDGSLRYTTITFADASLAAVAQLLPDWPITASVVESYANAYVSDAVPWRDRLTIRASVRFRDLMIATLLIPLFAMTHAIRKLWRVIPGHCPACGYDMRANPARCSECGRVAAENPIARDDGDVRG